MFEPGKRWQYGRGLDWAGRLVEAVSGMTLEEYFQQKILRPLGMEDTSYILPAAKFERLVSNYRRAESGDWQQDERKLPAPPKSFNGGGGLCRGEPAGLASRLSGRGPRGSSRIRGRPGLDDARQAYRVSLTWPG